MKIFQLLILGLLFLFLFSCEKTTNNSEQTFAIKVVAIKTDCGVPLIDFKENDVNRLKEITGVNSGIRYYAYQLAEEYHKTGQEVIVKIEKIQEDELSICTTMNPSYPAILIKNANAD